MGLSSTINTCGFEVTGLGERTVTATAVSEEEEEEDEEEEEEEKRTMLVLY